MSSQDYKFMITFLLNVRQCANQNQLYLGWYAPNLLILVFNISVKLSNIDPLLRPQTLDGIINSSFPFTPHIQPFSPSHKPRVRPLYRQSMCSVHCLSPPLPLPLESSTIISHLDVARVFAGLLLAPYVCNSPPSISGLHSSFLHFERAFESLGQIMSDLYTENQDKFYLWKEAQSGCEQILCLVT
ncbi:hypothetical protein AAY473_013407 [Plecturocebus cupreus]